MKLGILLTTTAAVGLVAFSAQAQLLGGQTGGLTGGVTGATGSVTGTVNGQVQTDPGATVSSTDRAVRDTTARSRGVVEATGKDARGVANAAKDVDVAGGVNSSGQVSTDNGVNGAAQGGANAGVTGADGVTSATTGAARNAGQSAGDAVNGTAATPLPQSPVTGSVSGSGSATTNND